MNELQRWNARLTKAVRLVTAQFRKGLLALQAHRYRGIIYALLFTNFVSVLLFGLRLLGAENSRYWFMLWNLALAWAAPLVAWWLTRRLRASSWRAAPNVLLTILWLGFLPNSFYMVSDLIHVHQTGEVSIIFDAVLFTSFIFNGFIAGFIGVMLVHRQLLKRVSAGAAFGMVAAVFALSGYAIYLGRVLRWNTWDALLHPAGLVFDVSDNILHPLEHPQAFVVTLSFTLLTSAFYALAWEFIQTLRSNRG